MATKSVLVELAEIHSAVSALEDDAERGRISAVEASKRINESKRAVTPRELWKASGGRAGAKKRGDWHDIRNTVFGVVFLLVLASLGVWFVTIWTGRAFDGGGVPEPPSISVPADQSPGDRPPG